MNNISVTGRWFSVLVSRIRSFSAEFPELRLELEYEQEGMGSPRPDPR